MDLPEKGGVSAGFSALFCHQGLLGRLASMISTAGREILAWKVHIGLKKESLVS